MEILETAGVLVRDVGFPVFVAVWLLVRSDRLTRELTKAIKALEHIVRECPKRR